MDHIGIINKADWGINLNAALETAGFMLGEEIAISCEIELINGGKKDLTMELEASNSTKGGL